VTWHEIWSIETWKKYSKISGFLGVILQTVAILTSKNIVVPSAQVLRSLENKNFSKKGVVIPNGIELHAKAMFKTEMLTKPSSVSLLYVGRLIKHKNCEFLLQIMALSISEGRDWNLTIVGAGPLAEKLKLEIKKLELERRVKIESNISNFDLDAHYKNCDVFLFPSEREGFGISVSEALSRNVPVIVYDVPENAAKDLISADVLSCKIDSLNAKIWLQATVDILNSKSTEKSESVFSELHTWESVGVQYSNYLKTLICNSSLGD
jgi:glycosyltransferase involved in cell wall biosynthesis